MNQKGPNKPRTLRKTSTFLIVLLSFISFTSSRVVKPDIIFQVLKATPPQEFSLNYLEESNNNEFMLQLPELALLKDERVYIWLEAENPELYLNIWMSKRRKAESALQVNNYGGNCVFVLGEGLFNGRLKGLKREGMLFFSIRDLTVEKDKAKTKYRIKVLHGTALELPFGKSYSMMIDPSIGHLRANMLYKGKTVPHLYKKRIQLTATRTLKEWRMEAFIRVDNEVFKLNPIFKKTVGGVMAAPYHSMCKETDCMTELDLNATGVEVLNIETFLIDKTEQLSIHHYGNYYDKVYMPDSQTTYELPYHDDMEGLDVSVTLMPVNDNASLHVNVGPRPMSLDKYSFESSGKLAKKITVPWSFIEETRANGQSIFIAVHCLLVGEYLLKVDAHEAGYIGSLTAGVVEAGVVGFKRIVNYLYFFEVAETQLIDFEVALSVVSGNVDLFLLQCDDYSTCMVESGDVEGERKGLFKIRDGKALKSIIRNFKCRRKKSEASSLCQFCIAALGKEQGASHFELSLHERRFHRLLTPGHVMALELQPLEKVYLKFSVAGMNSESNKLILSVESLWGHFSVTISKTNPYPSAQDNEIIQVFESPKSSLFESLKLIEMEADKFADKAVEGVYYVCIEAVQSSTLNIVFFEKSLTESSIHTLNAGRSIRGEITNYGETMYYTIPVSLVPGQASSVEVNLTPIKGRFVMMGSTNGRLPTQAEREYFANDNRLIFKASDARTSKNDYMIGIGLHLDPERETNNKLRDSFQYSLSLTYTNKPTHLTPGYIYSYVIANNNMYLIEVLDQFTDLLILKNSLDGFQMELCAHFSTTEDAVIDKTKDRCPFYSGKESVSLYLRRGDLRDHCTAVKSRGTSSDPKCFLVLRVKGAKSQLFRLGFTYNERPFRIVKDELVSGPDILDAHGRVNFVYAVEKNRPAGMTFNSKGRRLKMYARLVKGGEFDDSLVISFPTSQNYDNENTSDSGNLQTVYYTAGEVTAFGEKPELLISVRPDELATNADDLVFDSTGHFELQTSLEVVELGRTKTTPFTLSAGIPAYFRLYHNGNHDSFKVYIISTSAAPLKASISRGKTSRPGAINTPFLTKNGVGSVELTITEAEIKRSPHSSDSDTRGYFVVSVSSHVRTHLSVYWNNNIDINFLELTPNHPSAMSLLSKKKLYFSFYARGVSELFTVGTQKPQPIRLYIQSSVRAEVFMLTSTTGEKVSPSAQNFYWKESLGDAGGIAMLEISPDKEHYCSDCNYIGYVESDYLGQIVLVANVMHDALPVELTPGPTFPEYLRSGQKSEFWFENPDTEPINLSVSVLSGAVNVYFGREPGVSPKNFEKKFTLERHQFGHQFIRVDPKDYAISGPSRWYATVHNPTSEESALSLTLYKNDVTVPLESGLSKFVYLDHKKETHFTISPQGHDEEVRVQIEISRIFNPITMQDCLSRLKEMGAIYKLESGDQRIPLKLDSISTHHNRLHLSLKLKKPSNSKDKSKLNWDISKGPVPQFGLRLSNKCASPISMTVDLVSGNFKLVNLNRSTFGTVLSEEPNLYEAYGLKEKFLFIDVKPCLGSPEVSVFQSDFSDLEIDQQTEFEKLADQHSTVHYMKVKDKRVFFKIENGAASEKSVFMLNVFNERDMETNPYADVNINDADFQLEPEKTRVVFDQLKATSDFAHKTSTNFNTKVSYTLFLSTSKEQLQYARNCGAERLNEFFKKPELFSFSVTQKQTMEEHQANPKSSTMSIAWEGLESDTKYYGVLVAEVQMLSSDRGYLSPIRVERVYFNDFSLFTPRVSAPLTTIIGCVLFLGFLYLVFLVVKGQVTGGFSDLKKINEDPVGEDKKVRDMGFTGMKAFGMLEQVYYQQKRAENREKGKSGVVGEQVEVEVLGGGSQGQLDEGEFEMSNIGEGNGELKI